MTPDGSFAVGLLLFSAKGVYKSCRIVYNDIVKSMKGKMPRTPSKRVPPRLQAAYGKGEMCTPEMRLRGVGDVSRVKGMERGFAPKQSGTAVMPPLRRWRGGIFVFWSDFYEI